MPRLDARSTGPLFPDSVLSTLVGELWGAVFPPRVPPPNPSEDARTSALEAFAAYLAEVVFQIPNPPGPPRAMQLDPSRIHIEWPDDANTAGAMPSIEFIPGVAQHLYSGFAPSADEDSADVFGAGTVFLPQFEHVERIEVEVRATTRAIRRALLAGIEAALQPAEGASEVTLVTRHYGQTARFTTVEATRFDDEDSGRRRRRATILVEFGVEVVRLVNVARVIGVQARVVLVGPADPLPPSP